VAPAASVMGIRVTAGPMLVKTHAKRAKSTADPLPIVNAVGFTASTTLAN